MARPAEEAPDAAERSKRARILGAAMGLFFERGFAGTSTLDIASRARVSKRELYAQFASKEEMLRICIEERSRLMRRPLDLPAARDRAGLAATLIAFATASVSEVCKPEVLATYRLALAEAERSPEVARTLIQSGREANRAALRGFLAAAQGSGLLGPGDPAEMAGAFLSLLWSDLMMQLLLRVEPPPGPVAVARRARRATEALFVLYPPPEGDAVTAHPPSATAR